MGFLDLGKLFLKSMLKTKTKEISTIEPNQFLNERKEILWDVLELTSIGFWEWDIQNDVISASEGFYNICGINKGDLDNSLQKAIQSLVCPDQKEYVEREMKKAFETNAFDQLKIKIKRPDGKYRWILIKGTIKFQKGKKSAYGILMDVTKSQENEMRLHEHLDFFQNILDGIPFPIFYKDEKGIYTHCNQAFSDFIQTPSENIIGHTAYDISPADLAQAYHEKDLELIQKGGIQHYQSHVMQHTGKFRDVEFFKSVLENGRKKGIVGIIQDVTKWNETEKELKANLRLKDSMLEISQIVLGLNDIHNLFEIVIDKALETISSANIGCVLLMHQDGFLRVLAARGYEENEVPEFELKLDETYAWAHVNGDFTDAFIINDIQNYTSKGFPDPLVTEVHKVIHSSLSTPIMLDGELVALVNVDSYHNHSFAQEDIDLMNYIKAQIELTLTNLKLYQETLNLSKFDTLTGAYNRSYFDDMIEHFLTRAEQYNESFNVVIFDLDQLKLFNENHGHHAGDALLKNFVTRLKENIDDSDFLARYGGDEFIAVFFETDPNEIKKRLDTLNVTFKETCFKHEHQCFGCSFSYGIASYPHDGKDYQSLFSKLDKQLGYDKKGKQRRSTDKMED